MFDSQDFLNRIFDGLIQYLCVVVAITFHEFAHAWASWKCGDDTARLQGRVTLNPASHIDPIGTILVPLLGLFLTAGGSFLSNFIIGWGRPVPVNPANLRNRRRDDNIISLAGPAINFVLAFVLTGGIKAGLLLNAPQFTEAMQTLVVVNLGLCFFNLLPIPPLDGSHVLKNLIGMREEVYWNLCRYGYIFLIVALQIPAVRWIVAVGIGVSYSVFAMIFGI